MNNQPQQTYWERTSFFKDIDIAIIGSGIVGLSAAICCKERNPKLKVVVLEKGPLPTGASTRNAGFACFGSLTELIDDLNTNEEAKVFDLLERRWRGLQRLRERVGDNNLRYLEYGGYELFREEEESTFQECNDRIPYFNQKIASITNVENVYKNVDKSIYTFGFEGVKHLLLNSAEGQIHTGEMMATLLKLAKEKDVEVCNGLTVSELDSNSANVIIKIKEGWEIKSQQVIVATNGFTRRFLPELAVEPARNQVLITQVIPNLKIKGCFHYDKGYFYFRNIDNRILLGGGRNLAKKQETTDSFGMTHLIQEALTKLLQEVILPKQEIAIDSWWSGILGVGANKTPILKKISDRVVVAVRLGGMGIAIGSLLGEEGADLLMD